MENDQNAAKRFDEQERLRKRRMIKSAAVVTGISAAMVIGLLLLFTGNDDPAAGTRASTGIVATQYVLPSQSVPTATVYTPSSAAIQPTPPATTLYYGTAPLTTVPPATHTTAPSVPASTVAPSASAAHQQEEDGPAAQFTSADGTLNVDLSPSNKFIQIVSSKEGIDAALLTAVYKLPDTGQNYVLEWTGKTDTSGKILRTSDTVRRCYLIDQSGNITDVAASDFNECVGMNRIENSVAMETLIKNMLVPAIEKAIN